MKKVEIKEKKRIFNDFFKIDEVFLSHERFDGRMSPVMRRLNFERGDSAAAFMWNTENRTAVMTHQFRYPTYEKGPGWITEIVAGVLEKDENPEEAMRREILEETGYETDKIEYINTFYISPGGTSERIILYYAEVAAGDKVSEGGGVASEHEDIRVIEYTWPQLRALLENREIVDAKTIIASMWFREQRERRKKT